MSKYLRSLGRTLAQRSQPTVSLPVRFFHSPFTALNSTSSPLTKPPSDASTASTHYEKQDDHSPEPKMSHSGTQTYVVSEPDPAHAPYEVPSGAFSTSAPYANFKRTEPPDTKDARNEYGAGEGAAAGGNRQTPGGMGQKGESHGGPEVRSAGH